MKQEPVAWNEVARWSNDRGLEMKQNEFPSPVLQEYFEKGYKCAMESLQLSDEEILEVSHTMPYADRFDFARAILKKASEK
jgi:hypothetical protein